MTTKTGHTAIVGTPDTKLTPATGARANTQLTLFHHILTHRPIASAEVLGAEVGLPLDQINDALTGLIAAGLVAPLGPSGQIDIALALFDTFKSTLWDHRALRHCLPELVTLRNNTGESCYCSVDLGTDVGVIGQELGTHPATDKVAPGHRLPILKSSAGRVMLAFLAPSRSRAALEQQQAGHAETLTEDWLTHELDQIRRKGYAVETDLVNAGCTSLSVPVFSAAGDCFAALTLGGPSFRFQKERLPDLLDALNRAAHRTQLAINTELEPPLAPENLRILSTPDAPNTAASPTRHSTYAPQWSARDQLFYWYDKGSETVYQMDSADTVTAWRQVGGQFSGIALGNDNRLLMFHGNYAEEFSTGKRFVLDSDCTCAFPGPENEMLGIIERMGLSQLVLFQEGGAFRDLASFDQRVNCLSYCPASKMVYIGTPQNRTIYRYNLTSGTLQTFAQFAPGSGYPLSLANDVKGNLYVAMAEGWTMVKMSINGKELGRINLPLCYPTGIKLGGADGRRVMVTSEQRALSPEVLEQAPENGKTILFDLPKGLRC